MVVFIINLVLFLFSIGLIAFNFKHVLNSNNDIESRIKRFVLGGIWLLLIGIILVATSLIGSKNLDISIKGYILIILILLIIFIYIGLLFIWGKMYNSLEMFFSKKGAITSKYKFKSI